MLQPYQSQNNLDAEGRPAGGHFAAMGVAIRWQDGPLREQGSDEPAEPNGAFVETVIQAALIRLRFYQGTQFACQENSDAIACLDAALIRLQDRTARRTAQGIEGTHGKDPS